MKLKLLVLFFTFYCVSTHAFQQIVATVGEVELLEHDTNVALGNKTPLLLIHGWQPYPSPAQGNINIWNNLVSYIEMSSNLADYKIYYVRYTSNLISVEQIGNEFRQLIEQYQPFNNKQFTFIAHSMGGLVSRSFMYSSYQGSPLGGERITKLITLGTPHHGSPMANGPLRAQVVNNYFTQEAIAIADFELYQNCDAPAFDTHSRTDLRWDNFDNLYTTTQYATEPNPWLVNLNQNTTYDAKITAYVAYLKKKNEASTQYRITSGFLEAFTLNYVNDGIVPVESARFDGHTLAGLRFFEDYDHAQIAKGKSEGNTLDTDLFETIENDLLSNSQGLQITPSGTFDVGSTLINTTKNVTFSITNNSNSTQTFSISNAPSSDFLVLNPSFPQTTLDAGETKTVTVRFMPTTAGQKSHNITIVNSLGNINKQIIGNATDTSSSGILFGDGTYFVGAAELGSSVYKTIAITNTRHTTASIVLSGISSLNNVFEFIGDTESNFDLLPDETKYVTVKFSPTTNDIGLNTGFLNVTWSYPDISTPPPPGAPEIIGLGTLTTNGDAVFDSANAVSTYFQNAVNQSVGNITVANLTSTELAPLQTLQSIQGNFTINSSNNVSNLQFIRDLLYVSGDFVISTTNNLSVLDFVDFGSDITDLIVQQVVCPDAENSMIETDAVIDNLIIDNNQSLTDMSGLQGVKRISGNLTITNNASLTNLDGFSNLEFVEGGTVTIMNNPNLTDFCGLNKLLATGTFTGTLVISGNSYNPTLQNFVDGDCDESTLTIVDTREDILNVYPNPATENVNINTKTIIKQALIYDGIGRLIASKEVENNQLSVIDLAKGLYMIKFYDAQNNVHFCKLLKE